MKYRLKNNDVIIVDSNAKEDFKKIMKWDEKDWKRCMIDTSVIEDY